MKKISILLLYVSAASLATSCSTVPSKEEQGILIGAVAGGILGHQVGGGTGKVIATMTGTIAGAMIGGSVGRSMDQVDQRNVALTLENVRTDVPAGWVNPDTGYEFLVTPTRTYDSASGPCREYTVNAVIGGESETVYGTACRQSDGSWKIVN